MLRPFCGSAFIALVSNDAGENKNRTSDKMKLQFATVQTENNFGKKIVRVVSRHKTARAAIAASKKRADFQIAKLNFSGVLELTSPAEFVA